MVKSVTLKKSYFIKVDKQNTLHLKRFYSSKLGPPVFLLHGSIENGKIFYSQSDKGLAPFLAEHGYDVYVGDLRGRGYSHPKISHLSEFSQTQAIIEDIAAFFNFIKELRGQAKQHWIAHSWGGVLLSAHLARFPQHINSVNSLIYFGSKRTIRVMNFQRLFQVELIWKRLAPLIAQVKGFLPAKQLRMGSDNETKKSLSNCISWVKQTEWIDPEDGFNYGEAITKITLPPTLYFAGFKDACLGHPKDVENFKNESGTHKNKTILLSKVDGHLHNYGHIDMLTHIDAPHDHFLLALDWMQSNDEELT